MDTFENTDDKTTKDCFIYLDSFFKCCTVNHQFGKIYRDSLFDNCNSEIGMFKNCIMSKAVTDNNKKEVYIYYTIYNIYGICTVYYVCIYIYKLYIFLFIQGYLKQLEKDLSNDNNIFILKETPSWLNTSITKQKQKQ